MYGNLDSTQSVVNALADNLVVFETNERLLMVDLDGEDGYLDFVKGRSLLHRYTEGKLLDRELSVPSRTPGNYHVYLTTKQPLDMPTRILYQLILGSDKKREVFGLVRIDKNDATPLLMFETAENAEKVRSFLAGTEQTDKYMTVNNGDHPF